MATLAIEGSVLVNGIRLHYVDWGNSVNPPLLLLHGWDGTAHYWDLVAPAFRDRFHVVALTLRGRGRSDEDPTGDYRFSDYGNDIWEVTQKLDIQRMIFVGASLGGLIALSHTVKHPDQVEKLVLCDIGAQLGGERPSSYYVGMQQAPNKFSTLQEAEAWLREWSLYLKIPQEGMAIILRENFKRTPDGDWTWTYRRKLRQLLQKYPREYLFPSQWHTLSRLSCPVLIIRGGRSESLLPDVADRTRRELPNADLVEIPDCGHFPFLEKPKELIKALESFFV
jgi:esterase